MRLLLLSILILLTSCKSKEPKPDAPIKLSFDSSKIAIIPFTNQVSAFDSSKYSSCNLTQNDISVIEKIVIEAIADINSKMLTPEAIEFFAIDLKKGYKMQHVCVENMGNEKIVFVNCFCERFANEGWKLYVKHIDDGGSCAFNLKVNLSTKKYFDFTINGVA